MRTLQRGIELMSNFSFLDGGEEWSDIAQDCYSFEIEKYMKNQVNPPLHFKNLWIEV